MPDTCQPLISTETIAGASLPKRRPEPNGSSRIPSTVSRCGVSTLDTPFHGSGSAGLRKSTASVNFEEVWLDDSVYRPLKRRREFSCIALYHDWLSFVVVLPASNCGYGRSSRSRPMVAPCSAAIAVVGIRPENGLG